MLITMPANVLRHSAHVSLDEHMAHSLVASDPFAGTDISPTKGLTKEQQARGFFLEANDTDNQFAMSTPLCFGQPCSNSHPIGNCPKCFKVGMLEKCINCDTMVRPMTNLKQQRLHPFLVAQLWGRHDRDTAVTCTERVSLDQQEPQGLPAPVPPNRSCTGNVSKSKRLLYDLHVLVHKGDWPMICGPAKSLLYMILFRADGLRDEWTKRAWDPLSAAKLASQDKGDEDASGGDEHAFFG